MIKLKKILTIATALLTLNACNTYKNELKLMTMQPEEIISVTRLKTGTYEIKFLKDFKHKIVSGVSESSINWGLADEKTQLESFAYSCPFPEKRLIFGIINTETNEFLYVSEKHIPMQGTPNFRDLGGIFTKDNRQIKWGTIFRSGALANLTQTDLEYLKTLNIKKIIDFRTPNEIEQEPDRYPENFNVQNIHAMIGNPADIGGGNIKSIETITAEQATWFMKKAYATFINSLSDFQPIFDAMLNDGPNKPFLFHCTAGKDRTGISSALILSALNVDRDIIMRDYLLTNTYIAPFFESTKAKFIGTGVSDDAIKVMTSVKREYLQGLFDAIDQKYGSSERMLEEIFGITTEKRQRLIEKYTIS